MVPAGQVSPPPVGPLAAAASGLLAARRITEHHTITPSDTAVKRA